MFAKNKIIIDNSIILALSFLSVEHLGKDPRIF